MVRQDSPKPAADDLVPLGAVSGAWGVRGWVRIALYATDGEVLEQRIENWWLLRPGAPQPLKVHATKRRGGTLMAQWEGVESKEAADAFKGLEVAVPRSQFPALEPGEHYLADLVGRRVVNRQQVDLGKVAGLREVGPARWLEVASEESGIRLIPWVEQYVEEVDAESGVVRVDWQEDW
jgi:16S rRNA processing protein RimM